MKVLFAHDHKFRLIRNVYYSNGGLSDNVLSRYVENFGELEVIARVINKLDSDKHLSTIKNSRININSISDKNISVRNLVKSNDVIIVRLPSIIGLKVAALASFYGKPYLIELVAAPFGVYWYHSFKGKFIAPVMSILTRIFVKKSPYVLYVSKWFLQETYPTNGINIGCADVFLETPKFEVLEKRIDKIKSSGNNIIKLGLIGSLDVNYRGQDVAIRALSILNNKGIKCELHLLGGGNCKRWVEYARRFGVNEYIMFSGTLEAGEAVYDWIDGIDILVMPTLQETLGRSIIEAMSRGCPVLGSYETAIGEQIGADCLFKARDYKKLADLIEKLIKDSDYMKYCAYENFYRSFKYTNKQTDKIRNDFFQLIKKNINKREY